MHTLQEIEARLAEINTEVTTRGAEMTAEELTALETEIAELQEERSQLQAGASTQEQRSRILAAVAAWISAPLLKASIMCGSLLKCAMIRSSIWE